MIRITKIISEKIWALAAFGILISLASCQKDDENANQAATTEAKGKINEFNSAMVTDLQDLSDANGLQAVADLMSLVDTDDPFGRIGKDKRSVKQFFHKKGRDLKQIFIKESALTGRSKSEESFDFNSNVGVYEWIPGDSLFVKTGDSEMIRILFPTEGSSTNNAELRITAYQEVVVIETDEFDIEYESYEPSVIKASLLVNEIEEVSVDFAIDWDDNAFPITADISILITPFTFNLAFDNTNASASTLIASLEKDQQTVAAINVTANFENGVKNESNLTTLEGFVQLRNIKVKGSIDVKASDVSIEGDPNEYIDLALYDDEQKMGDIIFVAEVVDGYEEYIDYVQYPDGTKERLEDVLQPVIDEVDALTEELDDNG